ncbi:hypothetical protein ACWJJH_03305 [Endozoicomonadaceae bacterium StTr2]
MALIPLLLSFLTSDIPVSRTEINRFEGVVQSADCYPGKHSASYSARIKLDGQPDYLDVYFSSRDGCKDIAAADTVNRVAIFSMFEDHVLGFKIGGRVLADEHISIEALETGGTSAKQIGLFFSIFFGLVVMHYHKSRKESGQTA